MGKLGRCVNCSGIQHKQPLPKTHDFRIRTDYSFPIKTTKKSQRDTNSHGACGVILTEAFFYCFLSTKSQLTRTILGNINQPIPLYSTSPSGWGFCVLFCFFTVRLDYPPFLPPRN